VGYGALFVAVGTFHLIGFAAILFRGGKIQPLRGILTQQMESAG
jgi:ACS family hexuronate transporter-like MFS transporter